MSPWSCVKPACSRTQAFHAYLCRALKSDKHSPCKEQTLLKLRFFLNIISRVWFSLRCSECRCWRESWVHWNKKSNLDKALEKMHIHGDSFFECVSLLQTRTVHLFGKPVQNCMKMHRSTARDSMRLRALLCLYLRLSFSVSLRRFFWYSFQKRAYHFGRLTFFAMSLKVKNLYLIMSHPNI